ncbi:hypothetical protein A3C20_00715 [Candidatus Kaiserbacteria bacterium RIFCSPHIGHO2_02_FULL_55_25]|uniref:Peptidoglycan binding-like domain-containing protein n=1 Tax=Candidatus Kaiserbacteria bacterium RIFCSPHIGHO2_02_FULL_55_25 TaxID=1798498 RepID=A0A1F6E6Z8_9BACT|nr:MAG: hypothetical protein A2764_01020 [Candidatus Kaiserbacteria bacterium RIFCSPHIGHO2_01_FULL_55_79]OGG69474.1 MAG: hypothetical protein A3C20_00715 [Candidatus Kaiserbacteria bacterium RIFCSPHIGHO2_02_FULL_55_25]OGG77379.1 MAG: hypothetical protein A3F56_03800 [Candidatus Kaiserbacteria bacterium RIFCSPHIGHO2_12_FULL_55_13]OGG83073.1 MAG: hypothetical protein A3A42_04635 [Candidatus Kaiserbacteria bacterium RIFCSPLOWO2_01_FULL_55_25]
MMYSLRVSGLAFAGILLAAFAVSMAFMPRSASAAAVALTNATTTSSNASTTLIKTGQTLSFQLNLDGAPAATSSPQINIFGMGSTTMTGTAGVSTSWVYSTTSASSWTEGNVTFYMAWGGTLGEATSTFSSIASTTLSNVRYDKTVPTLSAVTVVSNNASTTLAKVGDVITLTATSSEGVSVVTITLGGNAATFTNVTASTTWQGAYTVQSGDTNGAQAISVAFTDYAGNDGVTVTTPSSGSVVDTDTVGPVITVTGTNPLSVYASNSTTYSDAGATATDVQDVTASVSSSGSVNLLIATSYTISYSSTDTAGNSSSASRVVTVLIPGSGGAAAPSSGGGGGSYTPISAPTITPPASQQNNSSLIASLQAQLRALLAQIAALSGGSAGFSRDMQVGSTGDDVRLLQVYLNTHGYTVAASGTAGSSGNETTKFGAATRAALIKLQKAAGITPTAGYFGPKTRAYIAANP